MAVVYRNELLAWYVTTLKLRENVESRLPKKSTYAGEIVPAYEPRPLKSEWVISIEKKLAQGRQENMPGSWAKLSIYRIPRYLKNGEDKAWVPQIVSLGPYHHGEEHLRCMEQHKWRCLHRIVERSGQGIALYLDLVKKVERRARACYEGRISMSCDEFAEMMVLDGCFVIEMFLGFDVGFERLGYFPNDPVFSMRESILQIQRDMIMLENQIPLFILDGLLGLQLGESSQKEGVVQLAIRFFNPLTKPRFHSLNRKDDRKRLKFDPLYDHGMVHCLEVFRRSLLHLCPMRPKTKQWMPRGDPLTYCLSELREAGILIRPGGDGNSLGNIWFANGFLLIPPLKIHEGTRSLFLNLIAFEQSHFNCSHYITSYVIFMHNLINSPEDVQHLHHHKVIKHCLGSHAEVVDLFHRLCQGVAFNTEDSYLDAVSKEVMWYRARSWLYWGVALSLKWNAWRAILKNKYFDNPWSIISFIGAFVLLVLTFLQSLYAVYGYYRPPRS